MQPRLRIPVLPRKAQRIVDQRATDASGAKDLGGGLPGQGAAFVEGHFRGAEVAGAEVAHRPGATVLALGAGE